MTGAPQPSVSSQTLNPAAKFAPHPDVIASIERAEALYRSGDYSGAANILTPLAESQPTASTAVRMLGLCHLRQGRTGQALIELKRAKELAPNDPWADLHLGFALHAAGRHGEAAELFRACEFRLPDDPAPPLNLAAALLELKRNRDALEAARRALRCAPQLAQAHYTLGLAHVACGELAAAETAYHAALRLAPRFADAWVNYGLVRYRRNDIAGAGDAMRNALAIDPQHRAALANFAVFERLTGDAPRGEAILQTALARDPNSIEARLNVASNLIHQERFLDALKVLDAVAPPSEPRLNCHWRAQQVLALIQLGRRSEARQQLVALGDGTPEFAPLLQWRWLLLSLRDGNVAQARAHAARMEEALQDAATMVPEHRIMAYFDLAKFWATQRHPDRAFPFWVEGHRLLGQAQPFSRAGRQKFIDANIAKFSRERLRSGPRAENRDQTPVFIVGMPRSCTTLTEQIIAAHPAAFGTGERLELGAAFTGLGGRGKSAESAECIVSLGEQDLNRAADQYLAALRASAPGAQRIVDKMPGNFDYLGLVGLMLPGARIIHCARDPRDIGLSIFTFRFYGHHPYAHDLGDLGWSIGRHHQLMAHWRDALPNPMITVQLSDWVYDFNGTLRRVLDFLDLPYDSACERFYAQDRRVWTVSSEQVRQPINARGIGRWRAYEKHLQPLFAELAAAGILPEDHSAPRDAAIALGAV